MSDENEDLLKIFYEFFMEVQEMALQPSVTVVSKWEKIKKLVKEVRSKL